MSTETPSTTEIGRQVVTRLRSRFPEDWLLSLERVVAGVGFLELRGPSDQQAMILAAIRPTLTSNQVGEVAEALERAVDGLPAEDPAAARMVIARYLSPPVRASLDARRISYADAVGNVNLNVREPGMLVIGVSAETRDPWRAPDAKSGNFKGLPARRVIRALVDRRPPWGVRELAQYAGTSLGSTSRTLDLLATEGLIERGADRTIIDVNWADLLLRWSDDYDPIVGRRGSTRIDPRGLASFQKRLAARATNVGPYAVSGSLAARQRVTVAEPRLAMVFVADLDRAIDALDLDFAPDTGNIMLIESLDDAPLLRAVEAEGLRFARDAQAFVDLRSGPGRSPQEADALLEWMRRDEPEWRDAR